MLKVNNTELADAITAYLAIHDPKRPFVVDGEPHTGMKSIFKKTVLELGLHLYALEKGLQETCLADSDILWSCCSTPERFVLDYKIACKYIERNHCHVIIIKTAIGTLEDYEEYFMELFGAAYAVKYELSLDDWMSWGLEPVGREGCKPHPRINKHVLNFLSLYPEYFRTEDGLTAKEWKTVSTRWSYISRQSWKKKLPPENLRDQFIAAVPRERDEHDHMLCVLMEYLDVMRL